MTKRQKWTAILCGTVLVILAIGYFAVSQTIDHFLKEGALDRAIGKKTAVILKADTGYLPLFWRGLSVHSNGILARGKPPRLLKELRAVNLKASCSVQELWQRKWVINRLHADRLEVAFGTAAEKQLANILPAEPELQPQVDTPSPLKVVIRETVISHTAVFWGESDEAVGALRDVESKFYPDGSDLNAIGTGGTFRQSGWPELHLKRVEAHYAKPKLQIRSAGFAVGKSEDVAVNGELDFGANGGIHLHTRSTEAPVEPFLKGF